MNQTVLRSAFFYHFTAEIHKLFQSKFPVPDLFRQRVDLVLAPSDIRQVLVGVIDYTKRQVERHGVGFSIHHSRCEYAVYECITHHIRDIQNTSGLYESGHIGVTDEDIRCVPTLMCKHDVVMVFTVVDGLIIRLKLDPDILSFLLVLLI